MVFPLYLQAAMNMLLQKIFEVKQTARLAKGTQDGCQYLENYSLLKFTRGYKDILNFGKLPITSLE